MGDLMEEDSEFRESEMQTWADKCYNLLKERDYKVKISENEYTCPYCHDKENQIFDFKELLEHVSMGAQEWTVKERGMHLALKRYIENVLSRGNSSSAEDDVNTCDLLVCPWMGILANIPTKRVKNGRYVGASGSKYRDELTIEGFNPVRVHPLWNYRGHSGLAIVEFRKDWYGLNDAIRFEKAYEANRHGKKDYFGVADRGDQLYGWIARSDDFYAKNVVGEHLQKNGDLKTIEQYQEEDTRKNQKLVLNLTHTIEHKDTCIREMETKYRESTTSLNNLIIQKDEMLKSFNEERERMQQAARGQLQKIFHGHESITLELEEKRNELKKIEMELETREAHNEKKRLILQQEQNERAIQEQKRVDAKMLELTEDHKKEQQKLNTKMIELEKQFDAKQALELEIQRLKGNLRVKQHMGDEDGQEPGSLNDIEEALKEKEEELDDLEALNQTLVVKERKANDELQEARKELIKGLAGLCDSALVGVKKMGELSNKAFVIAAKRKYSPQESETEAAKLCSQWEDFIKDPNWHPFKNVTYGDGKPGKVIDEEDEKLKCLKREYGDEAYQAVINALMEIEEYSPSGKYPVWELWNYATNKKAKLTDAISHLMKLWGSLKKKKKRRF